MSVLLALSLSRKFQGRKFAGILAKGRKKGKEKRKKKKEKGRKRKEGKTKKKEESERSARARLKHEDEDTRRRTRQCQQDGWKRGPLRGEGEGDGEGAMKESEFTGIQSVNTSSRIA
jgi:hypothetical protein